MPRTARDEKNKGLIATRRWRADLKGARCPEVHAVDTALAAAVTVYRHTAEQAKSAKDVGRVTALESMAINYLVSSGYSARMAERKVKRRVHRLDADTLVPMVNTKK
ncbi:hypothetical protein [Hoeflea alexandrii]|uniref:hypothetical protein n=1 Tax=Hoeflea alexandrii TaxID=288436 RepID=UPI0022AE6780|nr:hypothetical protein [Hoeflea alexandrii]MCZ4287264.1 hypothetical protein [Hoeflea alexandrii]